MENLNIGSGNVLISSNGIVIKGYNGNPLHCFKIADNGLQVSTDDGETWNGAVISKSVIGTKNEWDNVKEEKEKYESDYIKEFTNFLWGMDDRIKKLEEKQNLSEMSSAVYDKVSEGLKKMGKW